MSTPLNVWRKRVLQLPYITLNFRRWVIGIEWCAPEDEGYFIVVIGPIGFHWDLWP